MNNATLTKDESGKNIVGFTMQLFLDDVLDETGNKQPTTVHLPFDGSDRYDFVVTVQVEPKV